MFHQISWHAGIFCANTTQATRIWYKDCLRCYGIDGLSIVEIWHKSLQHTPISPSSLLVCWCRREAIAPLQTKEAVEVRRKSDAFTESVEEFRKFFLAKAPFKVKEKDLTLDHVSHRTAKDVSSTEHYKYWSSFFTLSLQLRELSGCYINFVYCVVQKTQGQ